MAGGRHSSTYSRFACYSAGNEAAATSPSPKSLTARSRFACRRPDTSEATNGTSKACRLNRSDDPGSYSRIACYGAAASAVAISSPTANPTVARRS